MNPESFMLRLRSGPRTAEEWIVFILAVAMGVGIDTSLKKKFPDMSLRMRRAVSYIPMIAILIIYLFFIKSH
ncbi:MAG: hypothetical protein MSJ26_01830 [Oscillospiraceae bacterium]|nr:hypothetical protein [Oscillospiraceae bacterium]